MKLAATVEKCDSNYDQAKTDICDVSKFLLLKHKKIKAKPVLTEVPQFGSYWSCNNTGRGNIFA